MATELGTDAGVFEILRMPAGATSEVSTHLAAANRRLRATLIGATNYDAALVGPVDLTLHQVEAAHHAANLLAAANVMRARHYPVGDRGLLSSATHGDEQDVHVNPADVQKIRIDLANQAIEALREVGLYQRPTVSTNILSAVEIEDDTDDEDDSL